MEAEAVVLPPVWVMPPMVIDPPNHCSNCQTTKEQLEEKDGSKLQICSCCYGDAYYGRECQQVQWPQHQDRCTDVGVWNLTQAIQFNDLDKVRKLSKSSPKVVNGQSKLLGVGNYSMFTRPLMACVRYDSVEALRILLESGSATKVDVKDQYGDTALHLAASKRDNVQVINLLLQHGANVNHVSRDGFSVLMMAARDFGVANTQCLLESEKVMPRVVRNTMDRISVMHNGSKPHANETWPEMMERKERTLELLRQYA